MASLFSKKNKKKDEEIETKNNEPEKTSPTLSLPDKAFAENSEAYKVLKNFYISEKSGMLGVFNQYVFKVFSDVNKRQVKRTVEKMYNVKVKDVKILNMPEKRKDLGRHPGFRSGFKKAIVVLEKGQTIEQAKA